MHATATLGSTSPEGRLSLVDTIAGLSLQFSSVRTELRDAQLEIARLRREVAEWRSRARAVARLDVGSLRRNAAFYCHPDRGGDARLMRRLNVLFDFLERSRVLCLEEWDGGSER